jgi:hypothetical protein
MENVSDEDLYTRTVQQYISRKNWSDGAAEGRRKCEGVGGDGGRGGGEEGSQAEDLLIA